MTSTQIRSERGIDIYRYWGKADCGDDFHPLPFHALDVAAVGAQLLRQQLRLLNLFSSVLEVDSESTLRWIGFWLALHDLGKFAVSFQAQREDLLSHLQGRNSKVSYTVRHDSLGAEMWKKLLQRHDVLGLGVQGNRYADRLRPWVHAVTGHHGQPPVTGFALTEHAELRDEQAAAAFTRAARELLLDDETRDRLLALPKEKLGDARLSWWLAGITVLADWLGSNTNYFPYFPKHLSLSEYWKAIQPHAEAALQDSGMLPLRRTHPISVAQLFDWQASASHRKPTPLQQWAEAVDLATGPQLFLLEDVTGAGKTEAALELAQRLIAADLADGIFFGLPTMATANAMYDRIVAVAGRIFDPETPPSTVLAHGQRRLHQGFRDSVLPHMSAERADRAEADETASARCAAWLADSSKKALLANIGVGTLDQALLGVLHARHQSLRLLGLFRKVLIVDEVHACDAYMQRLLETLLTFHAAAGGCSVLLTATLPQRMKQALVTAYLRGRGVEAPVLGNEAYPLATHVSPGVSEESALRTRPEVCRRVTVDYRSVVDDLVRYICEALDRGQCVCWIRNTIADALSAWEALAPGLPDETVTLFHARFAMGDRLDIEARVQRHFGPSSTAALRRGRLVIATQVIEQSLDVDFDVLISDLAPIDRLIQRAGRLQRHTRDAQGNRIDGPDERGGATLIVLGPTWTETPDAGWYKHLFPAGAYVYAHPGQLWLTARWLNRHGGFAMPDDGRDMVESVFGEQAADATPEALQRASAESEGKAWAATNLAAANALTLATGYRSLGRNNWATDIEATPVSALDDWSGDAAATRLGDPTMTVRLARWQDGALVPWCQSADIAEAWEASSLRLPVRMFGEAATGAIPAEAVAHAQNTMPDRGRWSKLLCLEPLLNQWVVKTILLNDKHSYLIYDGRCGLRNMKSATRQPRANGEQTL